MTLEGSVLITGGTGSLGQAILSRAHAEGWPATFIVYSRDEVKQAALAERWPDVRFALGDVQDAQTMARAMRGVDVVIHAAAYKRVPEAERETVACTQTNVDGSVKVLDTAMRLGVGKVVGISTDKACHPINAYGQSKALMERLFQAFSKLQSDTSFHLVRYGNVLASRGSVVPILQAQVAAGKPVTVTDPSMTRFWLTLDDAVDLVLRSLALPSGDILIPACRAASMAVLVGAIAPDAAVKVIGYRDGEKRHESLLNAHEAPFAARLPRGGWSLHPLTGERVDDSGDAYTSDAASQFTIAELREVVTKMQQGLAVRTLA